MPQAEWLYLLAGFVGGMFGAAIGAFPSFVVCGVAVVVGTAVFMATGDRTILELGAWGPLLGPHAAFAGGIAAAAYAARSGRIESGRDIVSPLLRLGSPAVLFVGGCFGCAGVLIAGGLSRIPVEGAIPWINSLALSITVNGLAVRLLFGRSRLLGRGPAGEGFPWLQPPLRLIVVSLGVGLPSASLGALVPSSVGLLFGVAAIGLLLLVFGWRIPVVIHTVLAAELFAAVSGSIAWGLVLGLLTAVAAEVVARLFLVRGDTHVDPPALALALAFALYPPLEVTGLLDLSPVVSWILVPCAAGSGWLLLRALAGSAEFGGRVAIPENMSRDSVGAEPFRSV